ncbi:hypothetical protein NIES2107_50260 [Nostoc carneum NIES-2107]|nr:hypothetical protein NIES2107_50260 [Nostoc carneum NIES-2107]
MKNRKWDMGKKLPMPNAPSPMPKAAGRAPYEPKREWSFPPLSKKEVVNPPLSSNQETQTF